MSGIGRGEPLASCSGKCAAPLGGGQLNHVPGHVHTLSMIFVMIPFCQKVGEARIFVRAVFVFLVCASVMFLTLIVCIYSMTVCNS